MSAALIAKMREFAEANQAPRDAAHWDQMCGSLMYRFNDWIGWAKHPQGDISSARRVAMGSGLLNQDASACPVGGFHYFDIAGINNGHVGMDATGGGVDVFMATWSVAEDLGKAIGFLSVAGYLKAKAGRVKYLGWATNYSGGTVDLTAFASLNPTPLEDDLTNEQARMLQAIYDAMFNGGPSMKDQRKSVSQSLAEISATVNKNVLRDTNGDGINEEISQIQDNADTNSLVRQLISRGPAGSSAPIDYVAIGAAVRNAIIKP